MMKHYIKVLELRTNYKNDAKTECIIYNLIYVIFSSVLFVCVDEKDQLSSQQRYDIAFIAISSILLL